MHPLQVRGSSRRHSPLLSTYLIISTYKHAVTPLAKTATYVHRSHSSRRSGRDTAHLINRNFRPASALVAAYFFRQAFAGLRICRAALLRSRCFAPAQARCCQHRASCVFNNFRCGSSFKCLERLPGLRVWSLRVFHF